MSWLKVDDGFEDHPKVEGLSNEAHRLWLRAACWCRKPVNSRTAGFVPRALLEQIAKRMAPLPQLLELVDELVAATAGGMFQHGLWEPRDGGWVFHDWADYQPESERGPTMSRTEAARVAGKKSAEARRRNNGSAQPTRGGGAGTRTTPERRPAESNRSTPETTERPERRSTFDEALLSQQSRDVSEGAQPQVARAVTRTSPERPEPPDPLPVPLPRSEAADLKTPQVARAQQAPRSAAAAASESASKVEAERLPNNLREALEWPICARADIVVTHPERAEWVQPQKWPEVLKVAEVLHTMGGLGEVRLGTYHRDSGVRAVVELFGAGYTPSALEQAARCVVREPWWTKDSAKRGLASLTPEVVRRALATGLSPAQEARVARAMGDRPPSSLGSVVRDQLRRGPRQPNTLDHLDDEHLATAIGAKLE